MEVMLMIKYFYSLKFFFKFIIYTLKSDIRFNVILLFHS